MPARSVTRRSPGGRYVNLSWNGADVASEVAGVRFAGGSQGRGFQIHPLGAHDFAMKHLTEGVLDQRLIVGGREVRVSKAKDGLSTTATLIGPHHELMTVFSGPAPTPQRITDLFSVLDIDDDKDGMRVAPADATLMSVVNEHVALVNSDFTSIDIPGPAHADDLVPRQRGRATKNGEVWRAKLPGRNGKRAHDFSYIVGTRRGAVEIVASDPGGISAVDLLAMVDSMNVSWRASKA